MQNVFDQLNRKQDCSAYFKN